MALVYLHKSDGTRNKYRLPANAAIPVQLGRNEDCIISLPDVIGISGLHCTIRFEDGRYYIKDENSTNGTLLNGEAIDEVELQEGCDYSIGDAILRFDAEAPAAPAAVTPASEPAAEQTAPAEASALTPPAGLEDKLAQYDQMAAPAAAAEEAAPAPKPIKAPKKAGNQSTRIPRPSLGATKKKASSPLVAVFVIIVLALSALAGMSIRHFQETGQFFPSTILG